MNNDLDYKNAEVIAKYPVEESLNTLLNCLDARQKDRNLTTFDIRNSMCAVIHSCIMMCKQLDQTITDTKMMVGDIKEVRQDDSEVIWGLEDNRPKVSDVEFLEQTKDWYENQALGLISLIWINCEVTHTSCLLFLSPKSTYGRSAKQKKVMKESMTNDYYKFIVMAQDNMPSELNGLVNTFKEERQGYSYTKTKMVNKFDEIAPVKQFDMLEKAVMTKVIQQNDRENKFDIMLDKQPVIIKEQVNK